MNLSDSLNWNIAKRMTTRGKKLPDGKFSFGRIRFSIPVTTNIIVAVGSRDAKQTWKYGGQCKIIVPGSPSSTSQFSGGIIIKEEALSLGGLKLFSLAEYPPQQYSVEIVPPFWFPSISYEAWWYDGENPRQDIQLLNDIKSQL